MNIVKEKQTHRYIYKKKKQKQKQIGGFQWVEKGQRTENYKLVYIKWIGYMMYCKAQRNIAIILW